MFSRKPVVALVLMFVILMTSMMTAAAETITNTGILLDNQNISSGVNTTNSNGTVYVTAKDLAARLGGSFSFDYAKLAGTIKKGENELVFRLDNSTVRYNGKFVPAPAPMKIINNRFMVPAQFVSNRMGGEVYLNTVRNLMMIFQPENGKIIYQVLSGDSLWSISQFFGTTIGEIKLLNGLSGDALNVGQKLIVRKAADRTTAFAAVTTASATLRTGPGVGYSILGYLNAWTSISVNGKVGDWYRVTTLKGSGYIHVGVVAVTQDINDTDAKSTYFNEVIPVDTSKDSVTYNQYTVQKGDTLWTVSEKMGILVNELAAANGLTLSSSLSIGQTLKVPVHAIPVKAKVTPASGEVLDWFKEAQYVFPIDKIGKVIDVETGKSFMIQRTMGANHSDTEPLTLQDTQTMKDIFGGVWSWEMRPFILEVDGRRIAVSIAGMPHAGIDGVPYLQNVNDRSGNFGYGPNYDRISGNGMDGHFDMYMLNCLRHVDSKIETHHQYNVLVAGGLQ